MEVREINDKIVKELLIIAADFPEKYKIELLNYAIQLKNKKANED